MEAEGDPVIDDPDSPLSGAELARLCMKKYDKYHDMAIKHTRIAGGMDRWVALNVYVGHLGQRSFPYTCAKAPFAEEVKRERAGRRRAAVI